MRAFPEGAGGSLSFGAYLKQSRTLRGLSLDEVATATKLPQKLVEGLEADDPAALADRAYALLAARACATFIGLDPEDTALRLEEQMHMSMPPPASMPVWKRVWRARSRDPVVWLIVAATVVACVLLFIKR